MAAYNINNRCEDCTFADRYGRACAHGLMFPVIVMISYGDMGKCPNFKPKTNEQIEEQINEMDEEIIRLLRENNAMLKEILRYIAKSNSSEEQQKRQLTSFAINVTANVFCEDLTEQEKII